MGTYVKEDGTVRVKIIEPGQGSSAFYEKEQLERDAAIFKGAHVYWDHPSRREAQDRPERSLRNLTGVITDTPRFDEHGREGPGVYGTAHVFKPYRTAVEEMAPFIGVSWRGSGNVVTKKVDGKSVRVAERFTQVGSVDFVTKAGAGGKAIPFKESAQEEIEDFVGKFKADNTYGDAAAFIEWAIEEDKGEGVDMAEKTDTATLTKLQESNVALTTEKETLMSENAKLKEGIALRDAKGVVSTEVAAYNTKRLAEHKTQLPDVTCTRLVESLCKSAPIVDGKLDENALKIAVAEAIKEEIAYIETITTTKAPGITGMGESTSTDAHDRLTAVFQETYRRTMPNRSEEEIKQMAETAARGR